VYKSNEKIDEPEESANGGLGKIILRR